MHTLIRRTRVMLLITIAIAGCKDPPPTGQVDADYPRADSPEARQATQAGWIPSWVPDNALQLREAHDLDTNESLLVFDQAPQGVLSLPMRCDVVGFAQTTPAQLTRPWWPSAELFQSPHVMSYRCPPDADHLRMYIAIVSGEPRVYVWRAVERR